ncbi:MAG: hypothetical protein KJ645_01690, partial [Planctomycetes bacterium]|nr:hypothetical protein [Planctomycetota bacterium]
MKFRWIIFGWLLCCSLGSPVKDAYAEDPDNPSVIKIYDLSPLLQPIHDLHGPRTFSFLPFITRMGVYEEPTDFWRERETWSPEAVVDLLHTLLGNEHFEHNGIRMDLYEDGTRLVVEASPDFQAAVAKVIVFLSQRMNRTVNLEVEVFQVTKMISVETDLSISRKQAIADGSLRAIFSRKETVPLDALWQIKEGLVTPIVWDYEPEIAEASTICEPIRKDLYVGLDLAIRPVLAKDGNRILMGIFASFSSLAEPLNIRDLLYEGLITNESGVQKLSLGHAISDPKVEFASLGTVVSVTPGGPEILSVAMPHHMGLGSLVVALSAEPQPVTDRLDLGEGMICTCHDLGYRQVSRFTPYFINEEEDLDEEFNRNYRIWQASDFQNYESCMELGIGSKYAQDQVFAFFEGYLPSRFEDEGEISDPFWVGSQVFIKSPSLLTEEIGLTYQKMDGFHLSPGKVRIQFIETRGAALIHEAEEVLKAGQLVGWSSTSMIKGGTAFSMAGF